MQKISSTSMKAIKIKSPNEIGKRSIPDPGSSIITWSNSRPRLSLSFTCQPHHTNSSPPVQFLQFSFEDVKDFSHSPSVRFSHKNPSPSLSHPLKSVGFFSSANVLCSRDTFPPTRPIEHLLLFFFSVFFIRIASEEVVMAFASFDQIIALAESGWD